MIHDIQESAVAETILDLFCERVATFLSVGFRKVDDANVSILYCQIAMCTSVICGMQRLYTYNLSLEEVQAHNAAP